MVVDLLNDAEWEYRETPPDSALEPVAVRSLDPSGWRPARVPGTVAGTIKSFGENPDNVDYDASDWWYHCSFDAPRPVAGRSTFVLQLDGLATLADVWVNDRMVVETRNMFRTYEVLVDGLLESNDVWIRFKSLDEALRARRPRPRWRSYLVSHQNLRFFRTSLLGRMPGWAVTPPPVGPYRPVRMVPDTPRLVRRRVSSRCDGAAGVVSVVLEMKGPVAARSAELAVGATVAPLELRSAGGSTFLHGSIRLDSVQRWWPHTHGAQPLYEVDVNVDGSTYRVGRVGFRTIELDRSGGDFRLSVNGVGVFSRGAVWMPVDGIGLTPDPEETRFTLQLAKEANLNLIRVPGTGVYQDRAFWDACDELGILVWQEAMLAFVDQPDETEFIEELEAELTEQFELVSGRPSLAVVCGGQEIEEQAAMTSLSRDKWSYPVLERNVADLVEDVLPGVPYVVSNPTGGNVPYQMDSGVSHYFGVGGYLRPLEDARRAGVRFASECLAFATPPERRTVDEECGGATRAGHDPAWKLAVHHDAGRSWDLEDMQGHYMHKLFRCDPFELRYRDPERALDVARATVATLFEAVLSEWRRPGSTCRGAIVLALRDLRAGPGWGVIDSLGRPKAPWFVMRRVLAPVALTLTDEGLNGLHIQLHNDRPEEVSGTVRVELFVRGELMVESVEQHLTLAPRTGRVIEVSGMFDGFRDLTGAFAFGPPAHDVVTATFVRESGTGSGDESPMALHLPAGGMRSVEDDVGLEVEVTEDGGEFTLLITTKRLAQWVVVEVPGWRPEDSWFHLAPGTVRKIHLHEEPVWPDPGDPDAEISHPSALTGVVRALNSAKSVRFATPL